MARLSECKWSGKCECDCRRNDDFLHWCYSLIVLSMFVPHFISLYGPFPRLLLLLTLFGPAPELALSPCSSALFPGMRYSQPVGPPSLFIPELCTCFEP